MIERVTLAAPGPHAEEDVGLQSLLIEWVDRSLPRGRSEPGGQVRQVGQHLDGVVLGVVARLDAEELAPRLGHLLVVVEQRAPAQQFDRHARERPAELVARQRQEGELAAGARIVVADLHAIQRRGVVLPPDEATGVGHLDAEGLVARAEKADLRVRLTEVVERTELGEADGEAGAG